MTTGVYLLHFDPPYKHAKHYLGWSPEVQARINAHQHGKGARLTEVAHAAGINMLLVRVWEDADRKTERKLKNRHSRHLCPICNGAAVQMPLMPWMPAYVPEPEQDDPHDAPTLEDADTDEYEEDMLDREFWARGQW